MLCFVLLKVNFPVVVTQLGVFDSNSDGLKSGLTVHLYDKISQVGKMILKYIINLLTVFLDCEQSVFSPQARAEML